MNDVNEKLYTRHVRLLAHEALACVASACADDDYCTDISDLLDIHHMWEGRAYQLADAALVEVFGIYTDGLSGNLPEAYAEAASMIMDGWLP